MTGPVSESALNLLSILRRSHQAALGLEVVPAWDRNRAIASMAHHLQRRQNEILEANTWDLEASREMAIPELILDWLKLTPERLQTTSQMLERLSYYPDPLYSGLRQGPFRHPQSQVLPLGVVALIYESFPELAAIAAGLCLKTGNSVILRGGTEASQSNRLLGETLQVALDEAGFAADCVVLLPTDEGSSIRDLVTQASYLNLIIPYGRPTLVQQVMRQATAPVLQTAIGNCYLYWGISASWDLVSWMITESHRGEPDAANAIEKVLVNRNHSLASLNILVKSLQEQGFDLQVDEELQADYPHLPIVEASSWSQTSLKKTVAFKLMDDLDRAIAWINTYSSGHADCLATGTYQESYQFAMQLHSATHYINASPHFSRQPQRGEAPLLGMAAAKGYRSGAIGLETLTKQTVSFYGNGPVV